MIVAPYCNSEKVCAEVMLLFKLFSNSLPAAWKSSHVLMSETTVSWDALKAYKKEQRSWR